MAAFVTTEVSSNKISGPNQPYVLVTGTYTSSAGATGGIIMSGYTNSTGTFTAVASGTPSIGGRSVVAAWVQTTTEDATTPKTATAYESTTYDRDQVTLTTVANGTGNYYLLCLDAGA